MLFTGNAVGMEWAEGCGGEGRVEIWCLHVC